jgi:hypothetical protein
MRDSVTGILFYIGIVLATIGLVLAIIFENKGVMGVYSMILPCMGVVMSMGSVMLPFSYKRSVKQQHVKVLSQRTHVASEASLASATVLIEK